jgi:hypothetical protein
MTTEEFTLEEKIDIRKTELKILRDTEILIKASTVAYKNIVSDIHMRYFLRTLLRKSKWNIFRFVVGAPIKTHVTMKREDKFMIKSYWLAKKNLKYATAIQNDLQNPNF